MAKETEILGMSLFNSNEEEMNEAQIGIYTEMASGRLVPEVAMELQLIDAPLAHRRVLESGICGKIVLLP